MPFEIVEAYIDQIVVILPWRALLAECTSVTVHGLELRLQPKKRSENGGSGMCHDYCIFEFFGFRCSEFQCTSIFKALLTFKL